jgi:HSP20 family protein
MFGITPYRNLYNPFRELERMEKEMFSGNGAVASFRTDIRDTGDAYLVEAELPGFKKEDIQVDVEADTLTIHAERKDETEKKDENGNLIHSERSYGSFERSFRFDSVDSAAITASYTDGVLKLTLPKMKEVPPAVRRLEIN